MEFFFSNFMYFLAIFFLFLCNFLFSQVSLFILQKPQEIWNLTQTSILIFLIKVSHCKILLFILKCTLKELRQQQFLKIPISLLTLNLQRHLFQCFVFVQILKCSEKFMKLSFCLNLIPHVTNVKVRFTSYCFKNNNHNNRYDLVIFCYILACGYN